MERCAFCGKKLSQVINLIKSPIDNDVYICDTCTKISFSIINGDINKKSAANLRKQWRNPQGMAISGKTYNRRDNNFNMTPNEIHKKLDRYVIGQEKAKKILSVALYNHYKRLEDDSGLIKKSNILLAGPSGTGKTLLASTMARLMNVPFTIVDATGMTETGYVGKDADEILQRLLDAADGDIERAQQGIVYIDEIDKLAHVDNSYNTTRDVSGRGVQQALLKMIEGHHLSIPVFGREKRTQVDNVIFDTSNVLFICGGAFEGLLDSTLQSNPIGFRSTENNISNTNQTESSLTPKALIQYGIIPEFVGRFPILCTLNPLTQDDLVRILTVPDDAITKEYQQLLAQDGVSLEFADEALEIIAQEAIKKGTGARSLRSILEDIMLDIMYDIPTKNHTISKCIITKDCIETKQPKLIKKRQRKKKAAVSP